MAICAHCQNEFDQRHPRQKNCPDCVELAHKKRCREYYWRVARKKRQDKRKTKLVPRKCRYCGEVFKPTHHCQHYCPGTNHAYLAALKRNKEAQYHLRKPRKEPKPKSKYKCRICGVDPYPNRFFCPKCHTRASNYLAEGDVWDESRCYA
jgi:hypothetical protein